MKPHADAGINWRSLGTIDPRSLHIARVQLHTAVQWLARAARAYVPVLPDDAHTSLGWDATTNRFEGHPFKEGGRLALDITDLSLHLEDESFPLHGRTDTDVRRWLGEKFVSRGLKPDLLDQPSPYAMPELIPAACASYDALRWRDAQIELAAWFSNAKALLEPIRAAALVRKLDASDVRCWPHHFDFATLISFPARGGVTGYVGVGLSPGDHYYEEPYFYISAYPRPDSQTLPVLPTLAHWHTHEFTAAIIPGHRIVVLGNQGSETGDVLKRAVDKAVTLLS